MLEDYPDGPLTRLVSSLLEADNERPLFHMARSRWKEGKNSAYPDRDKTTTVDGVGCTVGSKTNFRNESCQSDSALSCFITFGNLVIREDLHSPSLAQDYQAADRVLVATIRANGEFSESVREAYKGQQLRSLIEMPPFMDKIFGWRTIEVIRTIVPTYTDIELSHDNWDKDQAPT